MGTRSNDGGIGVQFGPTDLIDGSHSDTSYLQHVRRLADATNNGSNSSNVSQYASSMVGRHRADACLLDPDLACPWCPWAAQLNGIECDTLTTNSWYLLTSTTCSACGYAIVLLYALKVAYLQPVPATCPAPLEAVGPLPTHCSSPQPTTSARHLCPPPLPTTSAYHLLLAPRYVLPSSGAAEGGMLSRRLSPIFSSSLSSNSSSSASRCCRCRHAAALVLGALLLGSLLPLLLGSLPRALVHAGALCT